MGFRLQARRVMRGFAILLVAGAVTLMGETPAWADTCGAGYHYSGEETNSASVQGIQGELGRAGGQTLGNAIHIINYYDLTDISNDCGLGACWVQGGYGHGTVGGHANPSGNSAYAETDDVNGYDVFWSSTSYVPTSSYISVEYTGSSGGDYYFSVDAYTSNGEYGIGGGYLKVRNLSADINTETEYSDSGATCASSTGPFYYGANESGGYGASSEIESTTNLGSSWQVIGNSGWSTLTTNKIGFNEPNSNRYVFSTSEP